VEVLKFEEELEVEEVEAEEEEEELEGLRVVELERVDERLEFEYSELTAALKEETLKLPLSLHIKTRR
jgi:hypothetical protein